MANGMATLGVDPKLLTSLSQTFTVPAGTTSLQFTIDASGLAPNNSNGPPDAFEVALRDATTGQSLVAPVNGLNQTDSLLNIQETGQVYYSPAASVPGASVSGQTLSLANPLVITVDLSGVLANTEADLSFDLLAFGASQSTVRVSSVTLLGATGPLKPVIGDRSYQVGEGATLTEGAAGGVLGGSASFGGVPLQAIVVCEPANGSPHPAKRRLLCLYAESPFHSARISSSIRR